MRDSRQAGQAAREAIERRWFRRLTNTPALADLVTGRQLADEPFHRWLPYKQAFAPALVRRFLDGLHSEGPRPATPLLDPFAGTGTFAVECARQGLAAIGVEALPVLAFLARTKGARAFPPMPALPEASSWRQVAPCLTQPEHRAALILAEAARYTSDGRPDRGAPTLRASLENVVRMMQEDLARPLPMPVDVREGDARDLRDIADASIDGILTSPPYLSRHDYTRITRPHAEVHAFWYPVPDMADRRRAQVRAHPRAHTAAWQAGVPAEIVEAQTELFARGEPKLAGVVQAYFSDMAAALAQMARVLKPGRPCWIVVAGARLEDAYVPTDLVLAEMAALAGLAVEAIHVARRVTASGRKLGALSDVAPRESLLVLRR